MANEQVHTLLRYVRQVVGPPDEAAGTDGQLLRRFARDRDEAAFVALVQRYGPMVLGVCRRILPQAQDAEDAFQATFLVLVRKAHTLANGERLSNWLYGVAVRTASKLKVREARRRKYERGAASPPSIEQEEPGADLGPVLDQEIQQLPSKYRTPFLLCYLEGKTNREAAAVLGCPAGTISSRLAWARERLRTRLARRGIAPAALVGIGVAEGALARATAAAVAAELEARTVQGALASAAGVVSPRVVMLTREVLRAMFWTSWKGLAVVGLVAVSLIGAGVGAYASGMLVAGEPDNPPAIAQDKEPPKPEALKQEVARLQAELQKLQDEIALLQAKVEAPPKGAKPVLFRSKPAAYWIEKLEDRDPAYRVDAVKALGGIAELDRSVIPVLIASLKDRDTGVRLEAADALGNLDAAALPPLQEVMNGGSVEARRNAAMALGRIGRAAVPALAKALRDADDSVLRTAIENLIQIGQTDEAAIKALQAAGRDKDVQVRRRVIQEVALVITSGTGLISAQVEIGGPVLVEALNDPEMEIRKLALASLARKFPTRGNLQGLPLPPGLVPALIKLLKDQNIDKSLRKAAYDFLNRIDPAAAKEAFGLGGH